MARQQTLEASVAWSHDLLEDREQVLFRRLSVFSDGFTLEAAERVCADEILDGFAILESLTLLADKSLVQANADEGGTRYRLLETIRHYAAVRLLEEEAADTVRSRRPGTINGSNRAQSAAHGYGALERRAVSALDGLR